MSRTAAVERNTKETQIKVSLNLDGGEVQVSTGIGFFDHMLTAFGFYAGVGLQLEARGDLYVDGHHTVEDTGIGIPKKDRDLIFDRFYRVDKARSREAGGAGLGLSIVRDTVVANGGSISVDARPEGGTVFIVQLPLAQAKPEGEEEA